MTVRIHTVFIVGFAVMLAAHVPLHARADDELPSVEILSPQASKAVSGISTIRIAYQRGKHPIKSLIFFMDGMETDRDTGYDRELKKVVPFDARGEIAYDFNTKVFEDGLHRLSVRIVDKEGYSSQENVVIFIANAAIIGVFPPQVKITNLAMNQTVRGPYSIGVRATSDSGVAWVVLIVNHPVGSGRPASKTMKNILPENRVRDSTYQYAFPWDTTQLPNGTYVIQAKAIDFFDREGFSETLRVLVNNAAGRSEIQSFSGAPDPGRRPDNGVVVVSPKMASAPTAKGPVATVHPPDEATVLGADAKVLLALGGPANPGTSIPELGSRIIIVPPKTTLAAAISEALAVPGASATPNVRMLAVRPGLSTPTLDQRMGAPRLSVERIIIIGEPLLADLIQLSSPLIRRARAATPSSDLPDSRLRTPAQSPRLGLTGFAGAMSSAEPALPSRRPQLSSGTVSAIKTGPGNPLTGNMAIQLAPQALVALPATTTAPAGSQPQVRTVAKSATPLGNATMTVITANAPQMKTALAALGNGLRLAKTNDVTLTAPVATGPRLSSTGGELVESTSATIKRTDSFTTHIVRRGDTLVDIARSYAVPAKVIASANSISRGMRLTAGQSLRVPRTLSTYVNGREVRTNVKAFATSAGPAAPFRAVVEGIGGKVGWQAKTQTVTAQTTSRAITLRIGQREAKINDQHVTMDLAAFLFGGRTMVPATFFKAALNATVVVDSETGAITIVVP